MTNPTAQYFSTPRPLGLASRALSLVAGPIALGVGSALLVDPVGFEASLGTAIEPSMNLTSELRGAGGLLAVGGAVIGAGAFAPRLAQLSLWTATLLYLSYALSRCLGFALDGAPNASLLSIALAEFVLGTLSALALRSYHVRRTL